MASILIRQFAGQSVPPKSDAILYENATTGSGVIYGCNCTASDASTIHIDAGYGVIQGRFFEIEDQTISVTLAPSGTLLGQLYIHLDLSDADTPIDIYHEEAASLTAMTQQSGINYSNGIYEIQLCTYDVSTSTISNVVDTFPTLVSTATALKQYEYHSGDTITNGFAYGFVLRDNQIFATFNFDKPLGADITTVTFSISAMYARGDGVELTLGVPSQYLGATLSPSGVQAGFQYDSSPFSAHILKVFQIYFTGTVTFS